MDRILCVLLLTSLFFVSVELAYIPLSLFDGVRPKELPTNDVSLGKIWEDCSKEHKLMKIDNVSIIPDPPKIGQNVDIKAEFELFEILTGGEVDVDVQSSSFPVPWSKKMDLCKLAAKVNITCPIQKGKLTLHLNQNVPSIIPPGTYSGKVVVTDQNKQELGCFTVKLNLS